MRPRKTKTNVGLSRPAAVLSLLALVSACQTAPPVQEMSDARMAIAVAREAGAAEHAVGSLRAAEEFLQSAQRNLGERAYSLARRDALAAKDKAMEALSATEAQRPQ